MEILRKPTGSYEFILVGFNMASLTMAFGLAKEQRKFCILDCRHNSHSPFAFLPDANCFIHRGLPFNSALNRVLSKEEMDFVGPYEEVVNLPLTFTKGEFEGFFGFTEKNTKALKALLPYCENKRWKTKKSAEDFWSMAKPLVEAHLFLDQQVTDILFSERRIKEVILNGQTKISGEFFYFSDKLPLVFKKLGAQLGKQARQFAKIQWHSSILLTIHHKQAPKKFLPDQLYLLTGPKGQVFAGMFSWVQEELISRWQSFFPQEWIHSPESTGALLKEMRKQIQKAFLLDPVESIHGEFISIQDPVFADSGKTSFQNGKLSDFNNLFINSPCLSSSVGWAHQGIGSLFSSIPQDQEKLAST